MLGNKHTKKLENETMEQYVSFKRYDFTYTFPTALLWPREEEVALNMSTTAELGRGGGAVQAETNTGINKGQKQCML